MDHLKWLQGCKTEKGIVFYCAKGDPEIHDLDFSVLGDLNGDDMWKAMEKFNRHWVDYHMNIDRRMRARTSTLHVEKRNK